MLELENKKTNAAYAPLYARGQFSPKADINLLARTL